MGSCRRIVGTQDLEVSIPTSVFLSLLAKIFHLMTRLFNLALGGCMRDCVKEQMYQKMFIQSHRVQINHVLLLKIVLN